MVRDEIRKTAAVLAAVFLIFGSVSMASAGPVQTASAFTLQECDLFEVEGYTVDSWVLHAIAGDDCQILGDGSEEVDTSDIDDNQTALDIYSHAATVEQSWDEFSAVASNYLTDSRTVAYSKAQAAAVDAMDAGKSESAVKAAARQAVEDYYALRELNLLKAWETKAATLSELSNRANNDSGVDNKLIHVYWTTTNGYNDAGYNGSTVTRSYTLVNGTSVQYNAVAWVNEDGQYAIIQKFLDIYPDGFSPNYHDEWVTVKSQGTDYPSFKVLNSTKTSDLVSGLESKESQIANNIEKWVNGTYEDFQSGDLNLSEVINPMTLAQEYAQKYSETGYYAYAAASLAAAGYSVPNLNETASMTIAYNGSEYTGLLMSQNAPDGGVWEAGKTYDTDLIEGAQFFATNGEVMELSGTFQIMSMEGPDGESLNSTTTQTYSYQAINTSEYVELQESLTDLRTQLESLTAGLSSGGGGGLLDGFGNWLPGDLDGLIQTLIKYGSVILLIGGALIIFLLMMSAASG